MGVRRPTLRAGVAGSARSGRPHPKAIMDRNPPLCKRANREFFPVRNTGNLPRPRGIPRSSGAPHLPPFPRPEIGVAGCRPARYTPRPPEKTVRIGGGLVAAARSFAVATGEGVVRMLANPLLSQGLSHAA